MQIDQKIKDYSIAELPAHSKVWVYTSNKIFTDSEVEALLSKIKEFTSNWQSHGKPVKAIGKVVHNAMIILAADEQVEAVSGCSIDSSVSFIKSLQHEFGVNFFDRMIFYFLDDHGKFQLVNRNSFAELYQNGKITDDTLVFDPLVKKVSDLKGQFLKPLSTSWHHRMV